ncbi:MAG TPA: type II toxin-antitoxin system VapC family toxin [Candidatus Limnocylindrales bacterium]
MGALTILDAGVLIGFVEDTDTHHAAAVSALARARNRGDTFTIPAPAYAECLVQPYRQDAGAAAALDAFIDAFPIGVEPISRQIAAEAARLRARRSGLRLPDALVVATAIVLRSERILTTDRRWRSAEVGVPIEIVGD